MRMIHNLFQLAQLFPLSVVATSLLPGWDKPAPQQQPCQYPVLWFLVGLGGLRLEFRKFVNRRSPDQDMSGDSGFTEL